MRSLNSILILATAFLIAFFESTFDGIRNILGAQIELLPSLIVYASLSCGMGTLTLVAVCGGLFYDSLSANPLGVSVLPLFLIGFLIHRYRGLILRDQTFAQVVLGFAASAAAPLLTLLMLLNLEREPLIGWGSLWQWLVISLFGAAVTPLWFGFFDWVSRGLSYRPTGETTFRPDREIKRGRF